MVPWDSTIAFRNDPYRFIRRTCDALGTDGFETRLVLERVLCLTGAEATRFFYDGALFRRAGAAPGFLTSTLFGKGGVQGLDDQAHRHRKALFLELLGPGRTDGLTERVLAGTHSLARRNDAFQLQDAFEGVLTQAVCDWAGVPLYRTDLPALTATLSALFEHAGSVGPGQLRARRARRRADAWAGSMIERTRAGRLHPAEASVLAAIAGWRDLSGALLPVPVAAVELLNVLRPVVAVSCYLTFCARALIRDAGLAERLRQAPEDVPLFVEEVRRVSPFFPALGARARTATCWRDHAVRQGQLVVLDLWGTSRDPVVWDAPDSFDPERFRHAPENAFCPVPQGGGAHDTGHRCPGEWAVREVMVAVTRDFLLGADWSRLPAQDLSLDWKALPALPKSRLVVSRNTFPLRAA